MGERGRAARAGDQAHRLLGGQRAVGDVAGPAVGEEAVEGVLAVARVPRGDEGVGQVRAADGPGRAGGHVVEVDRGAGRRQPRDHGPGPRLARRPQGGEPSGERLGRGVAEVAEQVQRPRRRLRRELDARDHPHALAPAGVEGRGDPAQGVVVGDGEDVDARGGRERDEGPGLERPVRGDGVEVEVGPAGGYAVTARPTRPRASSSARTRAALASGDSSSVRTCTSGLGGAS